MSVDGVVWGIYTCLGWSGEVAEPIGSSVPVRAVSSETSAITLLPIGSATSPLQPNQV